MGVRPLEEYLDFDVDIEGAQVMSSAQEREENAMSDVGGEGGDGMASSSISAVALDEKESMEYDADRSNGEDHAQDEVMSGGESGDEEDIVNAWPGLHSSGHRPSWMGDRERRNESLEMRRHSVGSAARDSEFGLTIDDRNQLVGNRLATKIYTNAQQVVASLRAELRAEKAQMEEQTNTLASVLQQRTQGESHNVWQEKSSEGKAEYANLYRAQLKQNDALTLEMVKLRSQLDEAKRTAANAVAVMRGSRARARGGDGGGGNDGDNDGDFSITDESMADANVAREGENMEGSEESEGAGGLGDISSLLQDMSRKMQINAVGCEIEARVVLEFLEKLREQKTEAQQGIARQLHMLDSDMASLQQQIEQVEKKKEEEREKALLTENAPLPNAFSLPLPSCGDDTVVRPVQGRNSSSVLGKRSKNEENVGAADKKKTKIISFLDDLQSAYFDDSAKSSNRLQAFSRHLSTFTKYTFIKTLRTFGYQAHETQESPRESSLVSSIKLDMNEEFFAVGGLQREIQLFPYCASELESATSMLTEELSPIHVMSCDSNIASLAWSHHSRGQLASAHYDGVLKLWDSHTSTLLTELVGHVKSKRVWGVDYSSTQPGTLASASEDCSLKLWDIANVRCTASIPSNAPICCVKFHPSESKVAFGTSGSKVFLYDLRMTEDPLCIYQGHEKPVCGVDFLNGEEMVTQAVDSTLKLWHTSKPKAAIRTFQGHYNTKRFTGLTARNEFIMCGSEDNAVVVYNKMITTPFLRDSFNTGAAYGGSDEESFASSVCFNKHANIIIAGNSKGVVKIMKLE